MNLFGNEKWGHDQYRVNVNSTYNRLFSILIIPALRSAISEKACWERLIVAEDFEQ